MRGERGRIYRYMRLNAGSSPHARGTPACWSRCRRSSRFIPACAGNAKGSLLAPSRSPVHPRMRGERQNLHRKSVSTNGSSPHARGTRPLGLINGALVRFIPACAGNAHPRSAFAGLWPVHPRMRGERVGHAEYANEILRFIPACAGNAETAAPSRILPAVHPRMRGERLVLHELLRR